MHFPRFLHTQDVSLYGWSPQSKSQKLPNPRTNSIFLHTRNQAFPQILSEFEVAPKYSLPSPPLPSCFPLLPGAESEITIPRKVVVGTLNSYWSAPQREKLTVKVEKHRPAVASQEMFSSLPLPKAKEGAGPYVDSAPGAVSPESVGYGTRADTQGSSFPGNSAVARNRLLRGMAPSAKAAARRSSVWCSGREETR